MNILDDIVIADDGTEIGRLSSIDEPDDVDWDEPSIELDDAERSVDLWN